MTVLFTIAAAGIIVLWSLGALSAWRRIPYDLIFDSLYRHSLIVAITVCLYRFASVMATVNPLDKSEMWRTWCYLRWVLISGLTSWGFAALTPDGAEEDADAIGDHENIERAVTFLKGYAALLIVGMCGTYAGVKKMALKRGKKN